jgi:hypothetical protein
VGEGVSEGVSVGGTGVCVGVSLGSGVNVGGSVGMGVSVGGGFSALHPTQVSINKMRKFRRIQEFLFGKFCAVRIPQKSQGRIPRCFSGVHS